MLSEGHLFESYTYKNPLIILTSNVHYKKTFALEHCFSKFNQSNSKFNSFGSEVSLTSSFLKKNCKCVYKSINFIQR